MGTDWFLKYGGISFTTSFLLRMLLMLIASIPLLANGIWRNFLTRRLKFSGERDDFFNSLSAKIKNLPIYLIKINYLVAELWKSGDLNLCWKISFPKHALITTIYLYYILYVFISCLYVMFYQSSTLSLWWVYMCNFTICVISVCPSRAHNCNKIYLIWFACFRKYMVWEISILRQTGQEYWKNH